MEFDDREVYGLTIHPTEADWAVLHRVLRLCPPESVALRVANMARDPNVKLDQLVRHIECDPALTAQLLLAVNSARIGLTCRVNSVRRAVTLLGTNAVRLMATAFFALNPISTGLPQNLYQSFWKRSLSTAIAARDCTPLVDSEECQMSFTTGLLSDIGVLALAQAKGAIYCDLYGRLQHDTAQLIEQERIRFETDHIRIGGLLLAEFAMDSNIVHAIMSRSVAADSINSDQFGMLSVRLVLAHQLTEVLSHRERSRWSWLRAKFLSEFAFDGDAILDLILRIHSELDEWAQLFKLDVPNVADAEFRAMASLALDELSGDQAIEPSVFESFFGAGPEVVKQSR